MPVGLPESENIITAGAKEKNNVIFNNRHGFCSTKSSHLINPAMESGERYELSQQGPGGAPAQPVEIEYLKLKYCYTDI